MDFESIFQLDEDEHDDGNHSIPDAQPSPRLCEVVCRCVTFPMVLLFTFICIILIIIFCIFPGLFLVGSIVALYYCCSSDPIPIRVLLRALFASSGDDEGEQIIRSKEEIYEKLVCRECLGTNNSDTVDGDFRLEVEDHAVVIFSKPISTNEMLQHDDDLRKSSLLLHDLESQQQTIATDAAVDGATVDDEDGEQPVAQQSCDDVDPETCCRDPDDPLQEEKPQDDQLFSGKGSDLDEGATDIALEFEEGGRDNDEPPTALQRTTVSEQNLERKQDSTAPGRISDEGEPTATSRSILKEAAKLMQASPFEVEMATLASIESPAKPTDELAPPDCDICLLPYEMGQHVAWSKNLSCLHCFHLDCIADWLVKHQTCPNCRAQYI